MTSIRSRHSIDDRLAAAYVAITNALADPYLQEQLATYGYTLERIEAGKALYEQVRTLHHEQHNTYGELSKANSALEALRDDANATYMHCLRTARAIFRNDPGAYQKLALAQSRERMYARWMEQAQKFYRAALSDHAILAQFARWGISQHLLEDGKTQLDAVHATNASRQNKMGMAQGSTSTRNRAMRELDRWMRDFIAVARIALRNQPQSLERMGIGD